MQGPKKITLTKRYRVANENANCANQTLVDYYNAIWETGIAYDRASYTGSKKGDTRSARRVLTKNFTALLDKATEQRVVVVNLGAIPVPFPTNVYKALPQHLKVKKKEKNIFTFGWEHLMVPLLTN